MFSMFMLILGLCLGTFIPMPQQKYVRQYAKAMVEFFKLKLNIPS